MALTYVKASGIDITGNYTVNSIDASANVSAGNVKTNNLLYANGVAWSFGSGTTYSNSNVAAYLLTNTGNIAAGYFIGNGSTLSSITGANVTGQVGNALIAGTVYTAAQPNITSLGTLSSLSVTANASAGNIKTDNLLYANGVAWNLSGTYSNTNVAAYLPTYTGNFTAGNATISGAFAAGNITTSGTSGNISGANVITANSYIATATVNFTSTSNVALGAVGNVHITGGTTGQYLKTDGSGGLSWADAGNATAIINGTSNVIVYSSGNIATSSAGNANVFVVTGNSAVLTGAFTAANIITSGTSGNISGANNITANYFIGNGAQLSAIAGANVTGQVGNALVAGTVYTAAQPNITSVGTLTTVSVSGNVSSGGNIIGNGQYLTGITGANVVGQVSYAAVANSVAGSNVTGQVGNALIAGTVYTNAQPNITSVGTLAGLSVSGNVNVTGNINVTGNLNYSNVSELVIGDPLIYIGANNTGNLVDLGIVGSYNDGSYYHTGLARDHTDGIWKLFTNVSAEPTTTIDWANASYAGFKSGNITSTNASLGNLATANYFSGNGSLLTSITGGNVTGQVANALVAGTVYTAAQPNITSVGTLASVSVTGNVSSGGNIIGNGQYLTSITGGNVTGQVGNALVAGTVYTNAQPNITSVGTLTSLAVTANITAGNINGGNAIVGNYFVGNGSLLTGLPASYSNTNVASYLPTYTGNFSPSNLVVSTSANLGAVGNVIITGGSANYVLSTDGAGALSWVAQSTGGNVTSTTIAVDNFTGNGVQTDFTLSVTPTSVNSVFVNYNGAFVGRSSYSVSNTTLTFGSAPANGSSIEVTTVQGLTIGSGSFTTRTATGDGSTTNYTVTSGATVSSVLATIDGVVQTPTTDYTISGTTLTFTTAPYNGGAIQIRELSVASPSGGGISNTSIRAQAMTMGIIFGG